MKNEATSGSSGPTAKGTQRLWLPLLVGVFLLGAFVRLYELEQRSFSHIESFVPGIRYPDPVSDPVSHTDFWSVLVWAINDVHGPLWYLLMLPHTQLFGTGIFAIRLPAVVFGVAAIGLIYRLGVRVDGRLTGLLAAAFLAFNGHHLLWSQSARFYSMACMLALLSTLLLAKTVSEGPPRRWMLGLYLAVTCAGLITLHYFWAVFITQVLWAALIRPDGKQTGLLQWQIALFIAACPNLTLIVYQARPMFLGDEVIRFATQYVSFGFLLDRGLDTAWHSILPGLAIVLLALGIFTRKPERPPSRCLEPEPPALATLAVVTALSLLVILYAIGPASSKFPHKTPLLTLTSIFPLVGLASAWLLRSAAGMRVRQNLILRGIRVPGEPAFWLVVSLALLPLLVISVLSQLVPFFASRAMLLFTPFLLIVLASGVSYFRRRRNRPSIAAFALLLVLLAPVHYSSVIFSFSRAGPADYKSLAADWLPRLRESDLIFLRRHWSTTPIFYYMRGRQYRFIAKNYSREISGNSQARVWVLSLQGVPPPKEMQRALAGLRRLDRIAAKGLAVELYGR